MDGFGCESCHGPADKWIKPHTSAAWAKRPDAEKRALGFQPMDSLADRVRVCTACHVGSGERDVNHDLIAAGHPRLNFEFDTYYANLPRHWQENRDEGRAQNWLVGQVVCAEAALQLLAYRAEQKRKPWPEFAEYDCYACHHDLHAKSWRQERGYGQRVPGTLPWADWYYAMPAALDPGLRTDLSALAKLMGQPLPEQAQVKQAAQTGAERLKAWLSSAKDRRVEPAALFPKLIADERTLFPRNGDRTTVASWDIAAQMALALQAEVQTGKANPAAAEALHKLFTQLQFKSKTGPVDSPAEFAPPALVKQIQEVCEALQKK
jgi:hypothetical protein